MSDRISQSQLAGMSQVPATCMGLHVRRASRIITQVYDAALRPVDLVLSQFTLLVCINLMESAQITRLAQELYTDQTTLTRNLKLLKLRGLVSIDPGEDRRVKLVSLTDEGKAILAQALPLWEQAQAQVMQQFDRQEWQTLLSLLSDVKKLS
ncbi:MarR family winged helix-turn-helix transcriptional regulator [Chamaesiphon minutus]|uniref:Transcriptional regulator n=1 Tax=Chamaesiphon minutus (strain ATCC 27169 / PCC 6605) TaxID=1173020 RepID=K9UC16_CHAP6|nr:MarR family winged helix-turn-helix transcriptional regulator [Chamaesiphon minutus]AFY92178.1 transcriptional regulator [Chamaesiphon minutus PCC 6605]